MVAQLILEKVKPKTNSDCIDCKVCAKSCPMGSINLDNVKEVKWNMHKMWCLY